MIFKAQRLEWFFLSKALWFFASHKFPTSEVENRKLAAQAEDGHVRAGVQWPGWPADSGDLTALLSLTFYLSPHQVKVPGSVLQQSGNKEEYLPLLKGWQSYEFPLNNVIHQLESNIIFIMVSHWSIIKIHKQYWGGTGKIVTLYLMLTLMSPSGPGDQGRGAGELVPGEAGPGALHCWEDWVVREVINIRHKVWEPSAGTEGEN